MFWIQSILSGLLFGAWPLFMNRSGLSGYVSAMVFAGSVLVFTLPFGVWELCNAPVSDVRWKAVLGAGVCGGLGVLCFNSMLAKADKSQVGTYLIIMILVQIAVPAVNDMFVNEKVSAVKILGIGLAIVSAFLISKG